MSSAFRLSLPRAPIGQISCPPSMSKTIPFYQKQPPHRAGDSAVSPNPILWLLGPSSTSSILWPKPLQSALSLRDSVKPSNLGPSHQPELQKSAPNFLFRTSPSDCTSLLEGKKEMLARIGRLTDVAHRHPVPCKVKIAAGSLSSLHRLPLSSCRAPFREPTFGLTCGVG